MRDQLILEHTGRLTNYPQYPNGVFGDTVPRSGNIEGGGVFGWCYKCKGWETDPNAYVYIVLQREDKAFEAAAKALGKPEWINDPKFSTADARDKNKEEIYREIEQFTIGKDKFEAVAELSKAGVPCGPVLSLKEIENDHSLRENGTIVEVEQIKRGKYLTVGMPMKFSDFTPEIKKSWMRASTLNIRKPKSPGTITSHPCSARIRTRFSPGWATPRNKSSNCATTKSSPDKTALPRPVFPCRGFSPGIFYRR